MEENIKMEQGCFSSNFVKIIFRSKKDWTFQGNDNQCNRVIKNVDCRITAQESYLTSLVTLSVKGEYITVPTSQSGT